MLAHVDMILQTMLKIIMNITPFCKGAGIAAYRFQVYSIPIITQIAAFVNKMSANTICFFLH